MPFSHFAFLVLLGCTLEKSSNGVLAIVTIVTIFGPRVVLLLVGRRGFVGTASTDVAPVLLHTFRDLS